MHKTQLQIDQRSQDKTRYTDLIEERGENRLRLIVIGNDFLNTLLA